jgi:hypothetical protein
MGEGDQGQEVSQSRVAVAPGALITIAPALSLYKLSIWENVALEERQQEVQKARRLFPRASR